MASTIRGWAGTVRLKTGAVALAMGSGRECVLCGWTGRRFMTSGSPPRRRPDSRCPSCRSLARHRLAFELPHERIPAGRHTLHIAPEGPVTAWLQGRSEEYLSIDLEPDRAMRAMSLTDLDLGDDTYDLIFCSHVLEHVPDDRAAMRELRRVLRPGGQAVVLVPIHKGPTDEGDETTTTPEARVERFGLADHVRYYGPEVADRLESAGFEVEVLDGDGLAPEVLGRGSLTGSRLVFVGR